jgi:hypothetical protein
VVPEVCIPHVVPPLVVDNIFPADPTIYPLVDEFGKNTEYRAVDKPED